MDFTPLIAQAVNSLWYLLPLVVVATVIKSSWFKGLFGEFTVNLLLSLRLDKTEYHLIKNVTLPTEDGTTQIDHILVSRYGLFVVETKNMKGWIFGSEKQKQWTQQIYKSKNRFQNPLHQNYKHVKTLESCLNIPLGNIHSLIVFVGSGTFKTEMPDNVTYAGGSIRYIRSKTEQLFEPHEVESLITAIEGGRLVPGYKTNRAHVAHVTELQNKKNHSKTCSHCGSSMLERKGKKAGNKFWGCSAFPKCRNTEEIA